VRKNILIASADTIRLSADIFIAFSNAIRKKQGQNSITKIEMIERKQ